MTTSPPPLVLLASSDRKSLDRRSAALAAAGYRVKTASSCKDAVEQVLTSSPICVVAGASLSDGTGLDLIGRLRGGRDAATPGFVLAADGREDAGRAATVPGVRVVRGDDPMDLVDAVRRCEAEAALAADVRGSEPPAAEDLSAIVEALDCRARTENPLFVHMTDEPTGLWNEAYTTIKLADEFKKARRFSIPLSCVVIALDFRERPPAADWRRRIITDVAGMLLCESRDIDHLARFGDDSFVAVLPHTDGQGAASFASRVVASIERHRVPGPDGAPWTASGGISTFGPDVPDHDALVTRAREALAVSRRFGGNRVTSWSGTPAPTS